MIRGPTAWRVIKLKLFYQAKGFQISSATMGHLEEESDEEDVYLLGMMIC